MPVEAEARGGASDAVSVLAHLEDWATALAALASEGGLTRRIALVPSERVAHALRRRLLERNDRAALVGTQFLTTLQLAEQILRGAGESVVVFDPKLLSILTRDAIAATELSSLDADQLLRTPGWDDAIARTLVELEAADVEPVTLLASDDAHVRDLGRLQRTLRARAALATTASLLVRATKLAGATARLGPVLAVVTGFETAVEARFLRALPNLRLACWDVRPHKSEHALRTTALFAVNPHAATSASPAARGTRLALLQTRLFLEAGPPLPDDGSVRIVTYAGVHEEVEATVSWVIERILAGVAAADIALLAPSLDAYGPLLRARLSSVLWPSSAGDSKVEIASPDCVYVEHGTPALEAEDARRVLVVIRALREGLARAALAPVLPLLRSAADRDRVVSGTSRAWELLNVVACTGGERSHLGGGLAWPDAAHAAIARLDRATSSSAEVAEREIAQREGLRDDLMHLTPALTALTELLASVVESAPLDQLVAQLARLIESHVVLPPCRPPVAALLSATADAFAQQRAALPGGVDALDWLERSLVDANVQVARFGEPRVYVGTLSGARGLSFRAVRMLGLVEGAVPSATREDPVLPDAARRALATLLPTSRERSHRQIAAFYDAVQSARETLVLSAPRTSAERTVRQPAAVLLDVVAALGRAGKRSLERELDELARAGRSAERTRHEALSIAPSARLARIARGDRALAAERDDTVWSLRRLREIRDRTAAGEQDGLLRSVFPREALPGLTPERPISATRLQTLIACPHQFLYEHLLGLRAAEAPVPTDSLPSNTFGTWLHGIAEAFWREHGASIARREGTLSDQCRALQAFARSQFERLRETYPFANDTIARAQCDALCDQLDKLLRHDWEGEARTFVDVERGFGFTEPCPMATDAGTLFVRGKIDKLDRERETLLIRDIKTGAAKARKEGAPPEPVTDLQLGVYARVAEALAEAWGTPREVMVSYLFLRRGEIERAFRAADYALLATHTASWLSTAIETLLSGAFVRTPRREDCRFCPHRPVCEPELDRIDAALRAPDVPARLVALKGGAAR